MKNFFQLFIVITTLINTSVFSQVVIDDAYINAGETVTLTADTEWILEGYVFVESGAVLNIEPGTVIKAKPGSVSSPNGPTALIIAKGGKIFANGTPDKPIIFTAEADDINDLTDLPLDRSGLWGGVIILGNAGINVTGGEEAI
ncbi:T9SS C-terminal target domain-containing protein, partial [Candidatus Kapabacteria bacterium]|nr:T9SS C-terminal target domain-containing protein [Candidatus Kapabacteria bacterium]